MIQILELPVHLRPRRPVNREVQMTSPTTIADEVEALHRGFAEQIPDQVLSPLFAEQKMLDAAGVAPSGRYGRFRDA